MARPTKYRDELGDTICARIAGGETLDKVCTSLRITREVVRQWRTQYEEFGAKFDVAREDSADALADKAQRLLDSAKPKDAVELGLLREKLQHLRWAAKVRNPAKYGDKPASSPSAPVSRFSNWGRTLQHVSAQEVLARIQLASQAKQIDVTPEHICPMTAEVD
jgi:hypothetical protein